MAGVAFNGSSVSQSTKNGHVTYDIEDWVPPWSNSGGSGGGYWTGAGSGSTNALITANGVTASSPNVFVNGKAIATVGDSVDESWIANPSVPSNTGNTRYTNISPSKSGSGKGSVLSGSSSVFANGKAISFVGSNVKSHLDTESEITSGSSDVFVN
ncbi:hypothetical protein BSK59_15415 [Paenibacillus odorifer]|uniref:hypothetical protein n=1 Tax=Paenibacillus odorifer TaxID=189426 RepID=UPI00096DCAB4|nr:hypothetical protein [Paenibacillus odorifer]OME53968.1 hypothetical protein BSK59_15415 [Paenibacillus odorifer]